MLTVDVMTVALQPQNQEWIQVQGRESVPQSTPSLVLEHTILSLS